MFNTSVGDRLPPGDPFRVSSEALELAGKSLEKFILSDNKIPLLLDQLRLPTTSAPTFSGLSEGDYPNYNRENGFYNIKNFCTLNKVSLPPEIMEHFNHLQCHCMMGLFPEINRAWLTIDSDIYIWNFEYGSDVAYYDGLSETIISVGLVKPKPGVFYSCIKHLLVITTTVDIVVLGVTFKKITDGSLGYTQELHLTPDIIYSITTDGGIITTIQGTDNGRIFLGGKDGSLYEIIYQKELGWWGKRCKKVNHSTGALSYIIPAFVNAIFTEDDSIVQICVDNSRHILYTLTEKGSIEVFDLGESGQSTSRVTSFHQSAIVQTAVCIANTFDRSEFHPIVSLSVIEKSESPILGLVAVAESGARLYFTTGDDRHRPSTLQLVHVRLPPGFVANAPATRPNKVSKAIYSGGTFLLVTSPGSNQDKLWCLSNDAFPLHLNLSEAHNVVNLDALVWAIGEIKPGDPPPAPNNPQPPLIVRQLYEPPKKFVLLTPHGAEIIKKHRPVDMLVEVLKDSNGPDSDAVKSYFCTQGEEQAAAMCLILACNPSSQNIQLSEWATRAFFLYGSEPKIGTALAQPTSPLYPYSSLPSGFNPGTVSTPIGKSSFCAPETSTVLHSAKHNGLYLYLSRILRPLWDTRIVQRVTMHGDKQYLVSSVLGDEVAIVAGHLLALKSFLESNTQLSVSSASFAGPGGAGMDSLIGPSQRSRLQEAQLVERQSLDALRTLVNHAAQVLGLWRIVCNHQFHCIADALTPEQQNQMVVATFRDLILAGHELCASLINKLINTYLCDNASVDSISMKLREVCPKLYRNEDAACTKANEMLLMAKTRTCKDERQNLLLSALKLCKEVAPKINLSAVCRQFAACQFYEGILEMSLECAAKSDPKNIALHFYQNNQPPDDSIGYHSYVQRMECYKEVTSVLDQLHHQSQVNPQSPSIPVSPGAPQPRDLSTPTSCDALHHAKQLQEMALGCADELLHVAVYDWMVSQRLYSDLISSGRPTLEVYLKKATTSNPSSVHLCDLLWKYHVKNDNHAAAAQVLYNLAKQATGNQLELSERMTYLSKAVLCMRSDEVGCAPHLGVFLHELEDLMQVARVQKQVFDAVSSLIGQHPQATDAVTRLNSSLLTITELYEEFAEPFELWDCKLAIVECSGHDDSDLINSIWENIIQAELNRCTSANGDDKMVVVMSKVKLLGQHYSLPSCVFPLWFLVWKLELACCQLQAAKHHVHSTMISMGVPLIMLLEIYESHSEEGGATETYVSDKKNDKAASRLFALNDRCWINEGNELYLVEVIASFAETFNSNPNVVNLGERKKVAIRMQDLLTNCLGTLYSKPDTNDLINKLKTVNTNLNRV